MKRLDGCLEPAIGCLLFFLFVVIIPLAVLGAMFTVSPWGCEYRWPDQDTYWQPITCYVVIDDVRYPETTITVVDGLVRVQP